MRIEARNLAALSDRRAGHAPLVIPNLLSSNFVAEQLGKVNRDFQLIPDVPVTEIEDAESRKKDSLSVGDQLDFADRHGYLACVLVGFYPLVYLAASRFAHLRWEERREDLGPQLARSRSIRTPHGELREVSTYDKKTQFTHRSEEALKSEADLRAYEWLLLESLEAVTGDWENIRSSMKREMAPRIQEIKGRGLSAVHFWTPITEVFVPFLGQTSTLYFLHDYPDVARRLMDAVSTYTLRLVDLFNEAGVDLQGTALWGYETFNPTIYREHILPYVKSVGERVRDGGESLFWVHTCGRMKGLLEERAYSRFAVDLLECLNYPPAGDVDDWVGLRSTLPDSIITKGNLEDSLLLQGPVEEVRRKTREILIQSENFRHVLGTSNNIYDGTPLSNFQAMMETVVEFSRERGLRDLW